MKISWKETKPTAPASRACLRYLPRAKEPRSSSSHYQRFNADLMSFWGLLDGENSTLPSSAFEATKQHIHERNTAFKGKISSLRSELALRPARWVPDEDRYMCYSCNGIFSFLNRKHHCRECGEVFDAKCTSQTKPLETYPKQGPQRVCDVCYFHSKPTLEEDSTLDASLFLNENDFRSPANLAVVIEAGKFIVLLGSLITYLSKISQLGTLRRYKPVYFVSDKLITADFEFFLNHSVEFLSSEIARFRYFVENHWRSKPVFFSPTS
jgi:hypothetical protein